MHTTRFSLAIGVMMLGVVCLSASPAGAANVTLYLLAGQSNMVGNGQVSDLPTLRPGLEDPQTDVMYWYHVDNPLSYVESTSWEDLRPVHDTRFGPEITFGRLMADSSPGEQIAVIKYAVSGQDLDVDYRPTAPQGPSYTGMVNFVNAGIAELTGAGHTYEWGGMAWLQGESDGLDAAKATNYQTNLTYFVSQVRTDLSAPDLPMVISEIATHQTNITYRSTIRTAQENVVNATTDTWIVDPAPESEYPLKDSGTHFGSEAIANLGEDYAQMLIDQPAESGGGGGSGVGALQGTVIVRDEYFKVGDAAADLTYTGYQDTRLLDGIYANDNASAHNALNAGYAGGAAERGIMRFDLSALAGATVDGDGTLTLTEWDGKSINSAGKSVTLYLVDPANAGWLETQATWNNAASGTSWVGGVGGGIGAAGTVPSGLTALDAELFPGADGTIDLTIPEAVLQDWIDNYPVGQTPGLLLVADGDGLGADGLRDTADDWRMSFGQSTSTLPASEWPTLTFDVIPEPGTLALLGLGGGALLLRRRRRFTRTRRTRNAEDATMRTTRTITFLLAIACVFAVTGAPAHADLITARDGFLQVGTDPANTTYQGAEDTRLLSGSYSNKNFGAHTAIAAGAGTGYYERGLLRFRLDSALAGYTVTSDASLTLTILNNADVGETMSFYQVDSANASWVEGSGSNETAVGGEVTWDNRNHPSTAWVGGVGGGVGSGGSSVGITLVDTQTYAAGTTMSFTVSSTLVQSWIDNPSNNAGLLLIGGSSETDRIAFASSEYATDTSRPTLTFDADGSGAGGGGGGAVPRDVIIRDGYWKVGDDPADTSYAGYQDTRLLDGIYANDNLNGQNALNAGTGAGNTDRGIMRFDLSNLAGEVVDGDATLALTEWDGKSSNATGKSVHLYLVDPANEGWLETEATWNSASSGTTWDGGVGGGIGAAGSTPALTLLDTVAAPTADGVAEFIIPEAILQDWIDNYGAGSNPGLLVVADGDGLGPDGIAGTDDDWRAVFGQSNSTLPASEWPTLSFTLVPEPTTMLLLGLGAAGLIAKKKTVRG